MHRLRMHFSTAVQVQEGTDHPGDHHRVRPAMGKPDSTRGIVHKDDGGGVGDVRFVPDCYRVNSVQ